MTELRQTQRSGSDSVNLQAQTVNVGVSYADARQIALDVFKANFYELSEQANRLAQERAEQLVDKFLDMLKEKSPNGLFITNDPDIQHALVSAQIEYARTGDDSLCDILCNLLVDRIQQQSRNLISIVLNESLTTVGMLTSNQLDLLSLVFLLKYTKNNGVTNLHLLSYYIDSYLVPFQSGLDVSRSSYQHLEFSRCASISALTWQLDDFFKASYTGLFSQGFNLADIGNTLQPEVLEFIRNHSIACLQNPNLQQINALNEDSLDHLLSNVRISNEDIKTAVKNFFNSNTMTGPDVKDYLIRCHPFMKKLFDTWESTDMCKLQLTSVGIAIAHANIRCKTSKEFDLSIWIN